MSFECTTLELTTLSRTSGHRGTMTEKLKNLWGLVDEREEVYFILLLAIFSYAFLGREAVTGTEYIAGVAALYGVLIAGKAFGGKP